jgi:O-antigen/teichoic acid export membrane protein
MLIDPITGIASGLGGGFGDGATRFISMYRGRNDHEGVTRSFAAALTITCVLGSLLAIGLIVSAPLLLDGTLNVDPGLRRAAVVGLRISAVVLAFRFVDAVFLSAAWVYERYGPVVATSVGSRVTILAFAMALAKPGARPRQHSVGDAVVSLIGGYALLRHIGLLGGGLAKIFAGFVSLSSLVIVADAFRQSKIWTGTHQASRTSILLAHSQC